MEKEIESLTFCCCVCQIIQKHAITTEQENRTLLYCGIIVIAKNNRLFESKTFLCDGLENGILQFALVNYACYVFPLCSTYVIVR